MKVLFIISLIGFPVLYGIIRMYFWDLGRLFRREGQRYDPDEIYKTRL